MLSKILILNCYMCEILKMTQAERTRIRIGAEVKLLALANDGKVFTVRLVSPAEVNLEANKISIESPLGRALLGRTAGETVRVETPQGILVFEVLRVECAIEQNTSNMHIVRGQRCDP